MRTALVLLATFVLACGGDATAPDAATFAGTYALETVNGQKLPYVYIQTGNNSVTILNDRLTIADGGSWSETANVRVSTNGVVTTQTIAAGGSWARAGNQLALVNGANGKTDYAGTFARDRMDLAGEGLVFVFTK